jgi:alpha-amylase/alpha-mannosidase (GH57 family)
MRLTLAVVLLVALAASAASALEASPPTVVEGGVRFTFDAPDARSVSLAGEFNGWDPGALPMTNVDGKGVWEAVIPLQPGRTYQYKFVVNGGEFWKEDPTDPFTADDNHGGVNSVVSIAEDGKVVLGPLAGSASATYEPIVGSLPSLGRPLSLAIVWHQHQPKYLRDLKTGEYMEPWVRMHAIKDYYDMAAILRHYPQIHFTVNLTPVLLVQLQDLIDGWDNGTGTDAYLRMTLKDADSLTRDDQVYLLTHFFNANWDHMINIWPRYKELKDKKGGDSEAELVAAAATFTAQDWRDLQAWFNLAWFDPDFQEGDVTLPDGKVVTVKDLIEKGRGFTEADKRRIIETQIEIMKNVVPIHRELQDEGQIEVITTPFYHPILPLIYDTNLARVAMPGVTLPEERFSYPQDAQAQVDMAAEYYKTTFGRPPRGMWPAEGAVAQEIVPTVAAGGFLWMASDDQILQYSLGASSLTTAQRCRMYMASEGEAGVAMVFRDHRLSDDIGFNFGKMNGVQAANSMMQSLYSIHRELAADDEDHIVSIILDGENAWEWYPHDAKEFMNSWYSQLSDAPWISTVTVGGYLDEHPPTRALPRLWAGSWIGHDFATWIGEPEENLAWDDLAKARADLQRHIDANDVDPQALESAMNEIYAAEGSDWFWWYGSDQTSPSEGAFDAIYRGTLANAYTLVGEEPPDFLSQSILTSAASGAGGGVMARASSLDEATLLKGPVQLDSGILFRIRAPDASHGNLAGEFIGWSVDATPMSDENGDGVWTVVVPLKPGTYQYKFVIDGGAQWVEDAGNPNSVPDPYGGKNSVVVVG